MHLRRPGVDRCLPTLPRTARLQRKIREDPEISNAVAGGIAGEPGHLWGGYTGRHLMLALQLWQGAERLRCYAPRTRGVNACIRHCRLSRVLLSQLHITNCAALPALAFALLLPLPTPPG